MIKNKERSISNIRERSVILLKIIISCYFLLLLLLTYVLPNNVLEIYLGVDEIVSWGSQVFPSVNNLGEKSAFPQIAQLIFMLEVTVLPLLTILAFKQTRPIGDPSISLLIGGVFMIAAAFVFYFVWIPGDGIGAGFTSKISRSMISSKLSFLAFTTIFTFALAGMLGGLAKNLMKKVSQ
ncbi:MAG: hypothetical protein GXP14_11855 [Gammaproteobacteria bacterium]|nr:hypothetical protein [Gammaproteobacteria bacterium]